jgi:hypothetical protein
MPVAFNALSPLPMSDDCAIKASIPYNDDCINKNDTVLHLNDDNTYQVDEQRELAEILLAACIHNNRDIIEAIATGTTDV